LLAEVDMAQDTLSGPATRHLLYQGWFEFADVRYDRLAEYARPAIAPMDYAEMPSDN
jgi:hypothetical protein